MAEVFLITGLILLIQLAEAYLRYLPFANRIDGDVRRSLRIRLYGWGCAVSLLYFAIFLEFGITALTYKTVLMLGWAPYVIISLLTIRGKILQHIFIIGMTALWVLMQNNWVAMIDVIFFDDRSESTILIIHSILYMILYAAAMPIARRYFTTLLPDDEFFENRPQSYYITFMPLVIGVGHLFLWADERLFHPWAERFSRLYLLLMFFFIYRYVLAGAQTFFEHRRTMRSSQMIDEQLRSLERHNRAMLDNRQQMEGLRENLRAEYDTILQLLRAGDIAEVRAYISGRETMLDASKIIEFCRAPLINAAVSIYIHQAERHKIKCRHKINLPPTFSMNENDFSILLSNLLENAVKASRKQPKGARELSIIIQNHGRQYVLEIANRYDGELKLDKDGLPTTSREGHGIGMTSIKTFVAKYNAHAAFEQSNGWVTFSMYWRDSAA